MSASFLRPPRLSAAEEKKRVKLLRTIVCPEGLELTVTLAGRRERLLALLGDLAIMCLAYLLFHLLMYKLFGSGGLASWTAAKLFSFLLFNFYFLFFELGWQGRTPGKQLTGLRVISRRGGELTGQAVIARNLTRQAELYLPLIYLFSRTSDSSLSVASAADLIFIIVMLLLPALDRDRRRLGDFLGGTIVIAMPKAILAEDLAAEKKTSFTFTPEQLGIYGTLELQTLESALRLTRAKNPKSLRKVADNIIRKIGYRSIPAEDTAQFLNDFYAAERGLLEREQLFGRHKADQKSQVRAAGQPPKPAPAPEAAKKKFRLRLPKPSRLK
ncbi:MAG: RDD family protein [Deltaproteobacteria bacterium]|jgi:uncharacterized RDD family membrane protein YckC|nr:RDD family protein [Deltaproteobacteria bacterium]